MTPPPMGSENFGADALTNASPTTQSDQGAHSSTAPEDREGYSSPAVQQHVRLAAGSKASVRSSRSSGRSRRGCYTCRKRKVKCNEERPICGHCDRLQLACGYESTVSHDSSPRPPKHRRKFSFPRQQNSAVGNLLSVAPEQSLVNPQSHAVNTSRAQSMGFEPDALPGYTSTSDTGLAPDLNFDISLGFQPSQQRSVGPENWELELLGEDSLWANNPILPNFISVQDSPHEYVMSSYNLTQPRSTSVLGTFAQQESVSAIVDGDGITASQVSFQNSDQNSFQQADEITLLRHFVDFAVPPILIGVEPRWNTNRNALLRLSKSSLPLRHSICAFSALSLGDSPTRISSSATQPSAFYSALAMNELKKLLDDESTQNTKLSSYESILGSIFFLSYVEIIVSNAPKISVDLLDRAHTLLSQKPSSSSALYNQLQIWLKLLDAKVVSAGGKGFHLHTNPDTQDLEIVRENDLSSGNGEPICANANVMETEEILFNCLNRQAYHFYLQVLNFSGRIARLDKWHRSRGSVQDELEVMLAADKIMRDLNALWTRRPAIIDLADQREQLRQYMAPSLATKVEHHLRTYTANFLACFIHLQRVAYAHLQAISQLQPAVTKIAHLTRMTLEEGHSLPVSWLWPLMMAACEAEEETQLWIIECIEGMESKVGNATRTAKLVREIVKRQKCGQRADARTVMHEAFGAVFAIL